MKIITSLTNPEIKLLASLHTVKGRYEHKKFIAEGLRTIQTLMQSPLTLITVYCLEEQVPTVQKLNISIEKICIITETILKKISTSTTPSGMIALFHIPPKPTETLSAGIVFAQLQDPGNMGTLIRTAAAMGVKTVVCVESCDPWSPKVVQASAGTLGFVDIYQLSWQELLQQKNKLKLAALVIYGGKKLQEVDYNSILLVVGNEANGIPASWLETCEEKITLPMPGKTESLNAAVAGSIALYIGFNN